MGELGFDSLDAVEVVMALEEVCDICSSTLYNYLYMQEFSIVIPNVEADGIHQLVRVYFILSTSFGIFGDSFFSH